MKAKYSKTEELIANFVKNDRKLLVKSVENLTIVLKKYLPEDEYFKILLEQQDRKFWRMQNLRNFYDSYMHFWNEKRLMKSN